MSNYKKSSGKKFFPLSSDYEAAEKPNIEFLSLQAKETFTKKSKSTLLFFLLEGRIEASYRMVVRQVEKGYFFLMSANESYSIRCTDNMKMVICTLEEKLLAHHKRKVGLLYDICNTKLSNLEDCELLSVKMNRYIQSVLNDCIDVMDSSSLCARYAQCKTEELLILLRSYYPNDLLTHLFQPAFNNKVDFELAVKKNRDKLFTVEEFAAVTHLNRNTFRQKFKEVYGITPTEWIKQERANLVLHELTEGKKPIADIASDYKFSNFPNFIRFCNMHFKNTPGNIRKAMNHAV
jgi:AraC-like DNA-binding protein